MRIGGPADPRPVSPPPPSPGQVRHFAALDLMRAGAAGMVFLFHSGIPGTPFELANGLRVFFVLSGFVIYLPFARARLRGERVALGPYLWRRALRIYPAYLIAAFGVTALEGGSFVFDPWTLATISWWPVIVMWTLAVEIQFYALVPILDWVVRRAGRGERDRSIAVIVGFAAASLAYVAAVVVLGTTGRRTISHLDYANGLGYLWAFAGGMIVAELHIRRTERLSAPTVAVLVGAGLLLIDVGSVLQFALLDLVTVAGATVLLAGLTELRLGQRTAAVAAGVAAISYPFYLWHPAVIFHLHAPVIVTFVVSAAIASTLYLLVERPIRSIAHHAWRLPPTDGLLLQRRPVPAVSRLHG